MPIWDAFTGADSKKQEAEQASPQDIQPPTKAPVQGGDENGFSFAKLKDAIGGGESASPRPTEPTIAAPIPEDVKKNDNAWVDKIRDVLDGGESNRREAEAERVRLEQEAAEREAARKKAEEEAGLIGKIKGLFVGDEKAEEEERLRVEEAARKAEERLNNQGWKERIKDVFDGDEKEKEEARKREEEERLKNQSWTDKIKDAFNGDQEAKRKAEEERLKNRPIGDKIMDKVWALDKPQQQEEERSWLHEKLNTAAGGGAESETNEDHLDKAIDAFQKHILKEGDQHNESAFEQAKDEQISDGIRKAYAAVTGKEFFVKDKEH